MEGKEVQTHATPSLDEPTPPTIEHSGSLPWQPGVPPCELGKYAVILFHADLLKLCQQQADKRE